MVKKALLMIICATVPLLASGWEKTYGGFQDDYGYAIKTLPDNGFIIVGATFSYGPGAPSNPNIYLIRTRANGDTIWTKVIGSAGSDYGYSIINTTDGGFAIVGYSNSSGAGGYDLLLVRTDSNGDTLFTRYYGGYNDDFGYSIVELFDEGFVLVGSTRSMGYGGSDLYVVRVNSWGDTVWTKTFGGRQDDCGYSAVFASDGNILIAGYTQSTGHGREDVYILKIDLNGNQLWAKAFGGNLPDIGYAITRATDMGYAVAGYTESFGGTDRKGYIIKINESGDSLWARLYGGPDDDILQAIISTGDGGYAAVGRTFNITTSNYDLYFMRIDNRGSVVWEKTYGGSGNDFGYGIDNTLDGAFIITGWTRSFGFGGWNLYLIKTAFYAYVVYDLQPGWNLLSSPFTFTALFEDMFPYSTPPAYLYNTLARRYEPITTISSGFGFWVLNWGDTTYSILDTTGIGSVSGTLYPGWNLISGPSFAVPASELTSISGVVPPVYGYTSGRYYPTDVLVPGKGYWVLTLQQTTYRLPR